MAENSIIPGQYVEIAYQLFTVGSDGKKELVHTVEPSAPECFIFGVTPGLVEGLAMRLAGKKAGENFDIPVPSELGFPYSPDDVVTIPIDIFRDGDGNFDTDRVKVGAHLPMITGDGYQITGIVKSISPDNVVMDFNHPLVGMNLHFTGSVITVREATPEELRPFLSGCGGCCGGNGDCSDKSDGGCCGGCK
ncbi:MAG: peptidylprolyl isomerase [Duncaniella sp.]|nr:peptidylprolyl isomerase [Duncaniella sp.]